MFATLHDDRQPATRLASALIAVAAFALGQSSLAADAVSTTPAGASAQLVAQAIALEHGEGVAQDQRKAALLYCEAARAGDSEAMFSLGWMYANGRGVARSDALAAYLFARAADSGHAYAREMQRYVRSEGAIVPDCMKDADLDAPAMPGDQGIDPFANLSPEKKKIAELVTKAAPQYEVEPRLALAVIATESNFRPDAQSIKDARGLMQLVPGTAARFKVRNRLDVKENVGGGLAYLRWLLAYYQGQVTLAVAAYNAGEAAVDRYKGVPPYPETREYVRRVSRLFPNQRHSFNPAIAAPSPILVDTDQPAAKRP